jgi:hypothetical protein
MTNSNLFRDNQNFIAEVSFSIKLAAPRPAAGLTPET